MNHKLPSTKREIMRNFTWKKERLKENFFLNFNTNHGFTELQLLNLSDRRCFFWHDLKHDLLKSYRFYPFCMKFPITTKLKFLIFH